MGVGTGLAYWYHAAKGGLFSALGIMSKRSKSTSTTRSVFGAVIKWLQIMSFLFMYKGFVWPASSGPIKVITEIPSPGGWFLIMEEPYTAYYVLYYAALAYVILFVGLLGWAVAGFMKGEIPDLWPLRILSAIGSFSATVAYVPLVTLLLSVFICDNGQFHFWDKSQYAPCFAGAHLGLSIISALLSIVFMALASLFALVFFDSHPLTSDLAGKAHGRVDFFMLVVKTILIVTVEILPDYLGGTWPLIGINLAVGVVWVALYAIYMPYTRHLMNALTLALSSVYLWGGVCLALQQNYPNDIDGIALLVVGGPTAAGLGVAMAYWRRANILSQPLSKLRSVYEIEQHVRYKLQDALDTALKAQAQEQESQPLTAVEVEEEPRLTPRKAMDSSDRKASSASLRLEKERVAAGLAPPGAIGRHRKGGGQGGGKSGDYTGDRGLLSATYSAMDTDARAALVRGLLPSNVIVEAENLLRSAVLRFPASPLLHVFQARFYAVYTYNKHLNTSHLMHANRLSPGIDVAFLAYEARRSAEMDSSGALSSAMHRVSFDKHLADARTSTMKAAQAQVAFWQELAEPQPDIAVLHTIATDLSTYTTLADSHFKELFALHPQSLSAMRLFAQYNLCVANNPEKASAIAAEADRIEDQKNREQSGSTQGSSLTFMAELSPETVADGNATINVGATSRDLGIILSANAACCKLLGYTRLQLERRNMSVLVPAPFASSHDVYMRRYLSTGEGKFLETARLLFAKHRQGHLVPVITMIRELTLPDGTPVFSSVMRPITVQDHVVMLDSNFNLLNGTAGALMHIGVEAATLSAAEVSMADFAPLLADPAAAARLLAKGNGDVVQMHLATSAPGASSTSTSKRASSNSLRAGAAPVDAETVDVRATLNKVHLQSNDVYTFSWRLLSTNEAEARRHSIVARRVQSERKRAESGGGVTFRDEISAAAVTAAGAGYASREREMEGNSRAAFRSSTDADEDEDEDRGDSDVDSTGPAGSLEHRQRNPLQGSEGGAEGRQMNRHHSGSVPRKASRLGSFQSLTSADNNDLHRVDSGTGETTLKRLMSLHAATLPPNHPMAVATLGGGLSCPAGFRSGSRGEDRRAGQDSAEGDDASTHASEVATSPFSVDGNKDKAGRRGSTGGNSTTDGNSVASSSKRSVISRSTVNKLRRTLGDSSSAALNRAVPGLRSLYAVGWLLFFLNLGLGILSASLLDDSFSRYAQNLRFASVAGEASEYQVRSQRVMLALSIYARGWLDGNVRKADIGDMKKSGLLKDLNTQGELLTSRIESLQSMVSGTDQEYFSAANMEYMDFTDLVPMPPDSMSDAEMREYMRGTEYFVSSNYDGSILLARRQQTSLLAFGTRLAATMKEVVRLPLANMTKDDPRVQFIIANGQPGAAPHEKMKAAVFEAYRATKERESYVRTVVLWLFIAMGPILSCLVLALLVPVLMFMDRSRDDVMERFLDLPALVVAELRSQAEQRMKALRSDDGDVDSDDDSNSEDEKARGEGTAFGDADGDQSEDADGLDRWTTLFQRAAIEASREERKTAAARAKLAGKKLKHGHGRANAEAEAAAPSEAEAEAVGGAGSVKTTRATTCCASCGPSIKARLPTCSSRGKRAPGGGFYRTVVNPDGTTLSIVRRDFKKNGKSILALSSLLLPVLLMFLFYLALYVVTMDTLNRVVTLSAFTAMANRRSASTRIMRMLPYLTLHDRGYPAELCFRYDWAKQEIVDAKAVNQKLAYGTPWDVKDWVHHGLEPSRPMTQSAGSESTSVAGVPQERMDLIRAANLGPACQFITTHVAASSADTEKNITVCENYNNGVFSAGLQAVYEDLISRVDLILRRHWASNVAPNSRNGTGEIVLDAVAAAASAGQGVKRLLGNNSVPDGIHTIPLHGLYTPDSYDHGELETREVGAVAGSYPYFPPTVRRAPFSIPRELDTLLNPTGDKTKWIIDRYTRDYLGPAFQLMATWYSQAGEYHIEQYRYFLTVYTASFLVVFSAIILGAYLPAVNFWGRDVQTKRAMLLLLPATVTINVPSIRSLVFQIVAEQEGTTGGGRAQASSALSGTTKGAAALGSTSASTGPGQIRVQA